MGNLEALYQKLLTLKVDLIEEGVAATCRVRRMQHARKTRLKKLIELHAPNTLIQNAERMLRQAESFDEALLHEFRAQIFATLAREKRHRGLSEFAHIEHDPQARRSVKSLPMAQQDRWFRRLKECLIGEIINEFSLDDPDMDDLYHKEGPEEWQKTRDELFRRLQEQFGLNEDVEEEM